MQEARNSALISMIAMRIIYALNWLNIGSIFQQMSVDFAVGTSALGAMTSSFYFGIGLFQLPGGLVAIKYGSKKAVVAGNLISSVSATLSALSTNVEQIVIARFLVGAGMAFVFSPGVAIIARYFHESNKGYSVGIYNSAYDVGGAIALFLWGVIASQEGWRFSLLLSGTLGILTTFPVMYYVMEERTSNSLSMEQLKKVILDREMLLLSISLLSVTVASTLVGSFMIYYLEREFGFSEAYSGTVASMVVLVPIFSSILGGRLYDRKIQTRKLMVLSALLCSVALAITPIDRTYSPWLSSIIAGIGIGIGITVGFSSARKKSKASDEYEPVAVAWVNAISLLGNFVPPLVFAYFESIYGYASAWYVGSLIVLALGIPVVKLGRKD